jgi:hypothetical protein
VLAFSVVAIGSALHAARGVSIPNESLLVIQVFLSVVAMTSLLVSVTVSERNGHQGTLQKAKMELEERVLERTRELEDRIARQERAEKAVRGLSARLLQVKDQERLITGHHSAIDPRRWIKACGRKSKWGTNICVCLQSTTRSECRLPSTTSLPKLGLRLPSLWMILNRGRSELQIMPRNTSNVWGIWNCRLCDGRNRGPRSLDRSAAYSFLLRF